MTAQGEIEAEWISAPTKAWCHVRRTATERAEAPPQRHSQVHPPRVSCITRGWWWARSGWARRRVVVVVIEVPFLGKGFGPAALADVGAGSRSGDLEIDDPPGRPPRLCARRHPRGAHAHAADPHSTS